MDADVDNHAKNCLSCTVIAKENPPEPMTRTELPKQPWEYVAIDFYGAAEIKEKILVLTEESFIAMSLRSKSDHKLMILILRTGRIKGARKLSAERSSRIMQSSQNARRDKSSQLKDSVSFKTEQKKILVIRILFVSIRARGGCGI